ncbi:MAG: hypothetical protein EXR07_04895 [Acetobacteraceae bacterium]|nr:hypothetical protein [Acetobacteraceae bacterium]
MLRGDGTEIRIYCHPEGRGAKETAINERFATGFEAGLAKLDAGLSKPRGQKKLAEIQQRIGRLKEKSRGIGQHYEVTVIPDETAKLAASITWTKTPVEGSKLTHPGVCCPRSNEITWPSVPMTVRHLPPGSLDPEVLKDRLSHAHARHRNPCRGGCRLERRP